MQLLSNASATGQNQSWPGGPGVFTCPGTFGGATVTLQFLGDDGVTFGAMGTDTTLTAAGSGCLGGAFIFKAGTIRALVAGGSPSGLYASAERTS